MHYEVKLDSKGFPEVVFHYNSLDIHDLQNSSGAFTVGQEFEKDGRFQISDTNMPDRVIALGGYEIIQQYVAPLLAQSPDFNMFSGINQVSATMVSVVSGQLLMNGEDYHFWTSQSPTHDLVTIRWGGFTSNDITGVEYDDDIEVVYNKTYMSGSNVFGNETMLIIKRTPDMLGMEYFDSITIKRD